MLLWYATKEAIRDTHASFETGTRAWVVARSAFIKPTKQDLPGHYIVQDGSGFFNNRSGALSVELVNAGRSPALNVTMNARVDVLDRLPAEDLVIPTPPKEQVASKHVLAPDGTFALDRGLILTDAQFQGISSRKQFLTAYGDLRYDDIFNHQHETKFCYFYDYDIEKMVYCPNRNSTN